MKFKIKKKNRPFDSFVIGVIKLFKRKPKIINLNGEMPEASILIGIHSGASGPMTYRAFLTPPAMMTWGAHQMCEGYGARKKYLSEIFYHQKLGYGKIRAKICGTLFALVSHIIYGCAGIIPVYYDNRLKKTFEYSLDCLSEGVSVLVFPENSDGGYKEVLEEDFHPGYISLVRLYKAKTGTELPVYTTYYSKKKNAIVIGKPYYISKLSETMNKNQVNTFFREYMNSLRELI